MSSEVSKNGKQTEGAAICRPFCLSDMRDAYFAGIIDGEAYVGLNSKGAGKPLRLKVEVKMTCLETIEAIREHFGVGNIRRVPAPSSHPHWQDQHAWYVTYGAARQVLRQVHPYLITKRNLVSELIGFE